MLLLYFQNFTTMWPFDQEWFKEYAASTLKWAATDPWNFIYYVLLCLSPLFFLSAILAWQLAKQIEQKEKDKKRHSKKQKNIAKTRGKKTD